MAPKYLWEIGSLILTILGLIHLYFTFFTNQFSSENETVIAAMKTSFMRLTKQTTIWKAWIGFNGSHSLGVVFIGIINFYITVKYFQVFNSDSFYFFFNIFIIGFYAWLAKRYWFTIPFMGLVLVLFCYVVSMILAFTTA